MKSLNFVKSNPAIDEHELKVIEGMLGVSFPSDYRTFLLTNNGGLASECIFEIPGRGQSSVVFYGVNAANIQDDLLAACESYASRLPSKTVPIGFDPGGNQICLYFDQERGCAVYFWDHEIEARSFDLLNMWRLADNFSDFIDSLQFEDNEAW